MWRSRHLTFELFVARLQLAGPLSGQKCDDLARIKQCAHGSGREHLPKKNTTAWVCVKHSDFPAFLAPYLAVYLE
jgi:hypothetical protein